MRVVDVPESLVYRSVGFDQGIELEFRLALDFSKLFLGWKDSKGMQATQRFASIKEQ
jgi:hypothetical protein